MEEALIGALVHFGRTCIGLVLRPYETYRRIAERKNTWELVYMALFCAIYFGIASAVKTAAFRPFLLTKHFLILAVATGATYIFCVALFGLVARIFGRLGDIRSFAVCWGYTLVPTVLWFFMTSLLYVLLPPPRTTAWTGMLFSSVYLILSVTLLFWKVTLGYLSFRFGMKLDLPKIILINVIAIPILALYSVGMYRLGIFRIPFL